MTVKQTQLADVIFNVVENLSMMVVEKPAEWENFAPQLEGYIEFMGPVQGKLYLRCEEALAQALAANLLGTDNTDIHTQTGAWDALAELLNVVCGNLVNEIFDAQKPFSLSPPQINIITPRNLTDLRKKDKWKESNPEKEIQTVHFLLDGHPIEMILEEDKI
jgi:CheY-specific phosphatase CheX